MTSTNHRSLERVARWSTLTAVVLFVSFGLAPITAKTSFAQQLSALEAACVGPPTQPSYTRDEAIRACTTLIQNPSTTRENRAFSYGARGLHLFELGQYQRCIDDFDEAVRLNPNMRQDVLIPILAIRGMARHNLGQDDLALTDIDRVLRINPNLPFLHILRATIYMNKGEFGRAIANLDAALRLDSRHIEALGFRSLAYLLKGDYDRALDDADAVLRINPGYALGYSIRGAAHLKKENFDRAIADFTRAMELGDAGNVSALLREAREGKAALALRQAPAAGAERPVLTRRIALVIGNGKYQHVSPLPNAENDVADIGRVLSAMGYQVFGYPKANFTQAEMEAAIDAFQRAAVDTDTALIWYAGHGQEFREHSEIGANWLIPVDARIDKPSDVYKAGIAMSRLINAAVPARHLRIVIIDACRNSTLPSATRAIGPRLAVEQRSGMMIVFSTRSGTVALDGEGRNSPFAAAFLEATRDKSRLDVRQFFGAVSAGTLARTRNAQEPELLVRLQTDAMLPLVP